MPVPGGDGVLFIPNACTWGESRIGEPVITIGGEDCIVGPNATDDHERRVKGEFGFGAIAIGIIFQIMTYLFFPFIPFKCIEKDCITIVSDVGTYM